MERAISSSLMRQNPCCLLARRCRKNLPNGIQSFRNHGTMRDRHVYAFEGNLGNLQTFAKSAIRSAPDSNALGSLPLRKSAAGTLQSSCVIHAHMWTSHICSVTGAPAFHLQHSAISLAGRRLAPFAGF